MSLKQTKSFEDEFECASCGAVSKNYNSFITHLRRNHSLTLVEYRALFPNAKSRKIPSKEIEEKRLAKKQAKFNRIEKLRLNREQRSHETLTSGKEILICEICGFQSSLSLISHIIRKHKITMDDYRNKFPQSTVQQMHPKQQEKVKARVQEWYQNPENLEKFLELRSFPSELKHWTNKGLTEEEAKIKVSEFQQKISLKGNNDITRAKRTENNSGDSNPMSLVSIAERMGISIKEAKELTPCYGRTSEKHPMFGKKHTDEALEKIANAPHLSNPDYRSKPELELEEVCKLLDEVQHSVHIKRWNVDILFKNKRLIVEMFGDFWHMNPIKYKSDDVNQVMKKPAEFIWERDNRKLLGLSKLGYKVVVIWETDWLRNKDLCIEKVKNAYNQTL